MIVRTTIKRCLTAARRWLNEVEQESPSEVPFDNSYDWLAVSYRKLANEGYRRKAGVYLGSASGSGSRKSIGAEPHLGHRVWRGRRTWFTCHGESSRTSAGYGGN